MNLAQGFKMFQVTPLSLELLWAKVTICIFVFGPHDVIDHHILRGDYHRLPHDDLDLERSPKISQSISHSVAGRTANTKKKEHAL